MAPRIMYLHGMEGAPGSEKQKLLESVFGKRNVKGVNLRTRQTILFFTLCFSLFVVLFCVVSVTCIVLLKWYISVPITLTGTGLLLVCYWIAGRGVTHHMMRKAVSIAEKKFRDFRPNVIVAETFGAVIALNMDVPKVPLLLLAPAQDQFARFMKLQSYWGIGDFPYVMVVHGSLDKTVPLEDSIRLIETSEVGRCRLEVVDDNHSLKGVTEDEMRSWVQEVYSAGLKQTLLMAKDGNKHVDFSLFGDDGSEAVSTANKPDEV